jgi:hypothetical protein
MNLLDLTPQQLKRAASLKERIDGLKQTAARHSRWAGYIASCAAEKSNHERFCEKEDCGYSKSAVGEGSKFETDHGFCQTRGQKDRNQYGDPSEIVSEIESVLGGEEKIRQEVIPEISD